MRPIILIILAALDLSAQPTNVASTFGQCLSVDTAMTTGTSCPGNSGSNPGSAINTSGSALIILCQAYYSSSGGVPGTPTDSKSNTWTPFTLYTNGNYNVKMWYAIPTSTSQIGASHTFTSPATTSGNLYNSLAAAAFVGTAGSTAYDTGTATGNGTQSDMTITPAATNEALISCIGDFNSVAKAINGSFTILQESHNTGDGITGGIAWQAYNSTSPLTFKWTSAVTALQGAQDAAAFAVGAAPSAASNSLTPARGTVME